VHGNCFEELKSKSQSFDAGGKYMEVFSAHLSGESKNNEGVFQSEFSALCARADDQEFVRSIVDRHSSEINTALNEKFNDCIQTLAGYMQDKGYRFYSSYAF
jgi:hypothetical protein